MSGPDLPTFLEKPMIIGEVHSINLGGVDLSSYVTDAAFELSPWQASVLDGLPGGSMTLDFASFWNTPRSFTFEVTWDQLHPDTQASQVPPPLGSEGWPDPESPNGPVWRTP